MIRRRFTAVAAALAMLATGFTVAAGPASATGEAFTSLSPSSATALETVSLTAVVTLDTNATAGATPVAAGYYLLLPGFDFSGLTCANVTVTPSLSLDADSGKAGGCIGFSASRGGLNFASPYITGTPSRTYTITIAGLRAPRVSGTYDIGLANYDASEMFATQPFSVSAPDGAFLVTIDIDGNTGVCKTQTITGYSTTWASAPGASDCSKPGAWLFRGFNTAADGSGLAIAPGGNLHLTGDNRLYAIYYAPRAPGAPTDVVAVGGRNSVSVTWKAPSDLGEPAGASYVAQAAPSGARCTVRRDAQPGADGRLGCTIAVPASESLVDVTVTADNFFETSAPSSPSNEVRSFDLVLETVERPKARLLDRLFKGHGSTLSFTGRAPGLAGQKVTAQLKVGSGDWVSETGPVTVDKNGEVSWSKVLSKKLDDQPVEVRFAYGSETSIAYSVGVGQTVGLPSVPRNLRLTPGLGEYTVSWNPPANDGGSPVVSYVVTSNLRRFACEVKVPKTSCVISLNPSSATGPVDYTVAAVSARGTGKAAKANSTVAYRWIQPLSATTGVGDRGTELNILFYTVGLEEKQVTVELRIGKDGAWKKRGNPEPVNRPNRMYWSGILNAKAQNQPIYLRTSTPYGTSRERQVR